MINEPLSNDGGCHDSGVSKSLECAFPAFGAFQEPGRNLLARLMRSQFSRKPLTNPL